MSRTVLLTGATRGIGRAVANRLAAQQFNLCLFGRDAAAMAEVVRECEHHGARTTSACGDLTDPGWAAGAVDQATAHFGQIDVLINNAGAAAGQATQNADLDAWRGLMAINYDAAVHLSRLLLPKMIEREAGTIINISSLMGRNTEAGTGAYAASKHALNGFSGAMYEDVRDYGIKVSTIMPGFVETDLTQNMGLNADHMIRADDVADCVDFVLAASPWCCPTEIVLRPQKRP